MLGNTMNRPRIDIDGFIALAMQFQHAQVAKVQISKRDCLDEFMASSLRQNEARHWAIQRNYTLTEVIGDIMT